MSISGSSNQQSPIPLWPQKEWPKDTKPLKVVGDSFHVSCSSTENGSSPITIQCKMKENNAVDAIVKKVISGKFLDEPIVSPSEKLTNFLSNLSADEKIILKQRMKDIKKEEFASFLSKLNDEKGLVEVLGYQNLSALVIKALLADQLSVSEASNLMIQKCGYDKEHAVSTSSSNEKIRSQRELQVIPTGSLQAFKAFMKPAVHNLGLCEFDWEELFEKVKKLSVTDRLASKVRIAADVANNSDYIGVPVPISKTSGALFLFCEDNSYDMGLISPKVAHVILKYLYLSDAVEPYPTIGSRLSHRSDFENIDHRVLWVPCPGIVKAPEHIHGYNATPLEVLMHDYYHCHVESANPVKEFFLDFALHMKNNVARRKEHKESIFYFLYDIVLDREIPYPDIATYHWNSGEELMKLIALIYLIESKIDQASPDLGVDLETLAKELGYKNISASLSGGVATFNDPENQISNILKKLTEIAYNFADDFIEANKSKYGFEKAIIEKYKEMRTV